ncbi:MAG: DNA-formamidopyrimidine glycosylase, partial [Propionibacterium sp.]|nr:DNA-formamidopyrimidine glycosylase [Propionibacterium sp.]
MPELPEVEVVREGLAQFVEGRRIDAVRVLDARALKRHDGGPDDFVGSLVGRRCDEPRRRGKYLWIPLDGRDALIAHLGMSGQFRVDAPGAPLPQHARVVITMDDGTQLRFVDQRLFGSLAYCPGGAGLPEPIRHIALDPFDPHFRVEAVAGRLQAKH